MSTETFICIGLFLMGFSLIISASLGLLGVSGYYVWGYGGVGFHYATETVEHLVILCFGILIVVIATFLNIEFRGEGE
ncbi:MAG: hypothetical protein U9R01_00590 [candidate division WOR-3 bacterium]|nr:hypothetical protein [candidate division WOR-3 bacterium]